MTADPRIGRMVADRYRLEREIGRGGMGVVYAGTHTWTERPVAVKLLLPEHSADANLLKRFFQEAKAAAGLRHPNVVDVLDMGEDDEGSAFLVLELLEGESLGARLDRVGRLAPADALRVLVPVMDALEAAHARGIIYRDLKPANVFLASGHRGVEIPKLLDFGVAKLTEGASVQTRTGAMLGTPAYMSPEQIRGARDLSAASDVWGMGMLLHQTLVGRLPVEHDDNPTTMLIALVSEDRPTLSACWPEAPPHLAAVVDRCLARDLAARIGTMKELVDALLAAAEADGVELEDPRRSTPPGGR